MSKAFESHFRDRLRLESNYEPVELLRLNDIVLRQFGLAWDSAVHFDQLYDSLTEIDKLRIDKIVLDSKIYGKISKSSFFKDPRVASMFSMYKRLFKDSTFVFTVRHPMNIALSMHRRSHKELREDLPKYAFYSYARKYSFRLTSSYSSLSLENALIIALKQVKRIKELQSSHQTNILVLQYESGLYDERLPDGVKQFIAEEFNSKNSIPNTDEISGLLKRYANELSELGYE